MSDGITEIHRNVEADEERAHIRVLEADFFASPDKNKAGVLAEIWGNTHAFSSRWCEAKCGFYRDYLKSGELSPVFISDSPGMFAYRSKRGHGSWMGVDLDMLLTAVYKAQHRRDDAMYLSIEKNGELKLTPVTCGTCVRISNCPFHGESDLCGGFDAAAYKSGNDEFNRLLQLGRDGKAYSGQTSQGNSNARH